MPLGRRAFASSSLDLRDRHLGCESSDFRSYTAGKSLNHERPFFSKKSSRRLAAETPQSYYLSRWDFWFMVGIGLKTAHVYSLLGLSTHKNVKFYSTMTKTLAIGKHKKYHFWFLYRNAVKAPKLPSSSVLGQLGLWEVHSQP